MDNYPQSLLRGRRLITCGLGFLEPVSREAESRAGAGDAVGIRRMEEAYEALGESVLSVASMESVQGRIHQERGGTV